MKLKGRRVPELVIAAPQRATLPARSLALSDGRSLHYVGQGQPQLVGPGTIQVLSFWRTDDGMAVAGSMDRTPRHGELLHVSLSYPDHNPSWEDIKAVRAAFYPADIDVMMVLPQERDYVNEHPHCFHLWQTPIEWGVQ